MQQVQDGSPGVGPGLVTGFQLSSMSPATVLGLPEGRGCWCGVQHCGHPLVLTWESSIGAGPGALLGHGCRSMMGTGRVAVWGWP